MFRDYYEERAPWNLSGFVPNQYEKTMEKASYLFRPDVIKFRRTEISSISRASNFWLLVDFKKEPGRVKAEIRSFSLLYLNIYTGLGFH